MSERTAIFYTDFINQYNNLRTNTISTPTGAIIQFAGQTSPTGWLLCDGSEVLKSTYGDLYEVIGDVYGEACSSDKFVLPNLSGRVIVGSGSADGLSCRNLAAVGGEERHELSVCELPSHTHSGTTGCGGFHEHSGITESSGRHHHTGTTETSESHNHGGTVSSVDDHNHGGEVSSSGNHSHEGEVGSAGAHNHGGATGADGNHSHTSNATGGTIGLGNLNGSYTAGSIDETPNEMSLNTTVALSIDEAGNHTHTISEAGAHVHTISVSDSGTHIHAISEAGAHNHNISDDGIHNHGFTTNTTGCHSHEFMTNSTGRHTHDFTTCATGSSDAHNNMQPFIVLHYIIKY
jgi:microcystin-dependent protein